MMEKSRHLFYFIAFSLCSFITISIAQPPEPLELREWESFESFRDKNKIHDTSNDYPGSSTSEEGASNEKVIRRTTLESNLGELTGRESILGKRPRLDEICIQKYMHKGISTNKFELLNRSESQTVAECIKIANSIFHKKYNREKLKYFEDVFQNERDRIASHAVGPMMQHEIKIPVTGFPIVMVKMRQESIACVRIARDLEERGGQSQKLRASKPRVSWLVAAIYFLHEAASHNGLDAFGVGAKVDIRDKIINWVITVICHQTEDSLPLLGLATIKTLPENSQDLFGKPQKYLSFFLVGDRMDRRRVYDAALSLMGYWYKNEAPKLAIVPHISDDTFWRIMLAALESYKVKVACQRLNEMS